LSDDQVRGPEILIGHLVTINYAHWPEQESERFRVAVCALIALTWVAK